VPDPTVKPVKYRVSCVPEDGPDADLFTLCVEYREAGRWAVTNGSRHYAADGTISFGFGWDREPVTDAEIDAFERGHQAWLAVHRFDEDTALRIAREQAPLMRYRDYTVQDALDTAAESAKGDSSA
jgi:hypothetical protein